MKIFFLLLLATSILQSCSDEENGPGRDNTEFLVGRWDSYEMGSEQTGFSPIIATSLTLLYEGGIAFSTDGTFRPRYQQAGIWTEWDNPGGTFELRGETLTLLYFPGTIDEQSLTIQLVKLDQKQLWFKHSFFGVEYEYHLKKATN